MSSDHDPDPMPDLADYRARGLGDHRYLIDVSAWEKRNPVPDPGAIRVEAINEMEAWWLARAEEEIGKTVPKAIEYGADDLVDIGREMVAAGVKDPGTGDQGYAELGIFFYEVGKMARWRSAVRRGEPVSDDTLLDIGIYVRMTQRVRSHGGWPGTPKEDTLHD